MNTEEIVKYVVPKLETILKNKIITNQEIQELLKFNWELNNLEFTVDLCKCAENIEALLIYVKNLGDYLHNLSEIIDLFNEMKKFIYICKLNKLNKYADEFIPILNNIVSAGIINLSDIYDILKLDENNVIMFSPDCIKQNISNFFIHVNEFKHAYDEGYVYIDDVELISKAKVILRLISDHKSI